MGLYLDIVQPASEVMYRLERRGMPLDEEKRAAMVKSTEARVAGLETKIAAAAQEFHASRVAKIQAGIGRIEDELAAELASHPACFHHPKYRGLTQPGKRLCIECRTLWEGAVKARVVVGSIQKRRLKARTLLKRIGDKFDPSSPDHWRAWLFSVEGLKLTPIDVTPVEGKPSLKDDSIEVLWKRNPEVEPLKWRVQLAHLQHRLSGPLGVQADPDGMARFAYSLHRTPTGQTASGVDDYEEGKHRDSAGNAQNITDTLRQIFAARKGERVLHVDYSQIEARITAWNSRCTEMMRAYLRGDDVHSINAGAIYGIDPAKARTHHVRFEGGWVTARYAAKRATHGWNYGMGDYKTARLYGLKISDARRARAAYFDAWPEIRKYQDQVVASLERNRYLINPFGRKLRFYGWIWKDGRWQTTEREEGIAFSVASVAKDIAKAVMRDLDTAARQAGATLRTHTHDSFTFWTAEEKVPEVVKVLTPILERPWPQMGEWAEGGGRFWCPVDWAVGGNWAEAHEHDDECEQDCDLFNPDGLRKLK